MSAEFLLKLSEMSLIRDPDFPETITTDQNFMRNFRLYIKQKQICGPKAGNKEHTHHDAVDYEEVM